MVRQWAGLAVLALAVIFAATAFAQDSGTFAGMTCIGLNENGCTFFFSGTKLALVRWTQQGHKDSTFFKSLPGSFLYFAAHGVQDHIHIADGLLERPGRVVDNLVSAKAQHELPVLPRSRSDNAGALPLGHLDRHGADAAGRRVHKDRLPC